MKRETLIAIHIFQIGDRLQISADVDAVGLVRLQNVLSKYAEILKLLEMRGEQSPDSEPNDEVTR